MYGAYVHLPWCRIRCAYCAFVVSSRRAPPHEELLRALTLDWSRQRDRFPGRPDTLFFGGGTPSRTPTGHIAHLVRALDPLPGAEVSLEANPEDCDDDTLSALADAGVNRLSIGVQSFREPSARRLGRTTAARFADRAVSAALRRFPSVSVDLIFAGPGQALHEWQADLDHAVSIGVHHVSAYGLTREPGTPFARAALPVAEDDLWRSMYDTAVETFRRNGLARYEVSNFAREGHRCRHNELYWRARPWVGLGPGAHGWEPDGTRTVATSDIDAWLAEPTPVRSRSTARELAAELIGSTLRHVDGVDRELVRARTGLDTALPEILERQGVATMTAGSIRLTNAGFPLADGIAARICAELRTARAPLPS